jgi:hypothetical protein
MKPKQAVPGILWNGKIERWEECIGILFSLPGKESRPTSFSVVWIDSLDFKGIGIILRLYNKKS